MNKNLQWKPFRNEEELKLKVRKMYEAHKDLFDYLKDK